MKLYMHPVSMTSRPVRLFIAENGIEVEEQVVDLFTGEHMGEDYGKVNPNRMVPVLEDGDLVLTESSAILKYLADKTGSASYPNELRTRARVNERMDWLNTGLYRELGYGAIYPQTLPHYKREDAAVQAAHLAWGCEKARRWLTILDSNLIGSNAYLCGDQLTIADYLGIGMITLGEVTRFDYAKWKNLSRWIDAMKARPNWSKVNEAFYAHFVTPYKDAPFVAL
jgi:glutathione S-transferase